MRDVEHTEIFTHKSGKKYHVEWTMDTDMGSPLQWEDTHGCTVELEWNPTNAEQLEQHIVDNEPELEEETSLRMMRELAGPRYYGGTGLYYDVMASLELARTEWGITDPAEAMAAVEKDYAYLKGWYDDEWHWVCLGVAPLDEDGNPDESCREHVGGYESTIMKPSADDQQYHDDAINDLITEIEYMKLRSLHPGQLELELRFA